MGVLFMANKSNILVQAVAAGGNEIIESPVIPNGKVWVIKKFGGAIPNLGDNYSGNVVLRFGTTILRVLTLCGSSQEIQLNSEVTGNGSDKLNVVLQNPSTNAKDIVFWYDAYERE